MGSRHNSHQVMIVFMELFLDKGGILVVRLEGEDSIFNVYIERQV